MIEITPRTPDTVQRGEDPSVGPYPIVRWRAICPCGRPTTWRLFKWDAERDLRDYRADVQRLGRCH